MDMVALKLQLLKLGFSASNPEASAKGNCGHKSCDREPPDGLAKICNQRFAIAQDVLTDYKERKGNTDKNAPVCSEQFRSHIHT